MQRTYLHRNLCCMSLHATLYVVFSNYIRSYENCHPTKGEHNKDVQLRVLISRLQSIHLRFFTYSEWHNVCLNHVIIIIIMQRCICARRFCHRTLEVTNQWQHYHLHLSTFRHPTVPNISHDDGADTCRNGGTSEWQLGIPIPDPFSQSRDSGLENF